MGFEVYLFGKAESDYEEALNWYKTQSTDAADRFLQELADALEALTNHPTYYSYSNEPYRRVLLKSFPYRIVYKSVDNTVLVYALSDTRRSDTELNKRLL